MSRNLGISKNFDGRSSRTSRSSIPHHSEYSHRRNSITLWICATQDHGLLMGSCAPSARRPAPSRTTGQSSETGSNNQYLDSITKGCSGLPIHIHTLRTLRVTSSRTSALDCRYHGSLASSSRHSRQDHFLSRHTCQHTLRDAAGGGTIPAFRSYGRDTLTTDD